MKSSWWAGALLVGTLLAGISSASAQDEPIDAPQPDKSVRDPEFGVVARYFGLERQVEMYQWRAAAQDAAGQHYVKVWSGEPIDLAAFTSDHANPPFPLKQRRWLAKSISIDGKPLAPDVIAALGEWRNFRPSFSALPGNLAATFQPEGDGLGSAENPLDPQIGDLRIRWRELTLPPLQDRVVLRDGRWQLPAQPAAVIPAVQTDSAADAAAPPRRRAPWLFGSGALVVLIVALAARRRRRKSNQASNQTGE